MGAFPAPSLRELSSEARLRECTTMNVTGKKSQSFVGAMKIARQPRISASTPMNGASPSRLPL